MANARTCELYKRVFALRNQSAQDGGVDGLISLFHETPSVLIRHEVAYALGQMQEPSAVPFLNGLLCDAAEHPIVRHEAAEALGAIATDECCALLEKHKADAHSEVSETCALALCRLANRISRGPCACERRAGAFTGSGQADLAPPPPEVAEADDEPASPYVGVDPTPPLRGLTTEQLRKRLLDRSQPLFERYGAMFALRNLASEPARAALCEALNDPAMTDSSLFKHEVAFVLGQLEHPSTVSSLCRTLRNESEHPMVRHEAAEALGAIGSPEAMQLLREFSTHGEEILRESCVVAIHMYDREAFAASGVAV